MSVSAAKRRANRLNAQKSSGPVTAEGKARSSQNAITHGLFCSDLLIGQETAEELAEVEEHVMDRMRPGDVVEMELTETYIRSFWKLRRLRGVEQLVYLSEARSIQQKLDASYEQHPSEPEEERSESPHACMVMLRLMNREDQMLERLGRYEHRLQGTMHRCMRELRQLQKDKRRQELEAIKEEEREQAEIDALFNVDEPNGDASRDASSDRSEMQNEATDGANVANLRPGQRLPEGLERPLTPRLAKLMAAVQKTVETSANLQLKNVI